MSLIGSTILPSGQASAWTESNKYAHYVIFSSFVAFSCVSILGFRLLRTKAALSGGRDIAQVQHATALLFHAVVAMAAGALSLAAGNASRVCGTNVLCFEPIAARVLDVHIGYLLSEWVFFHNNSTLLRPRFPLLGLHHLIYLLGYVAYKMHPGTLTLQVLPWYQLFAAAQWAEALLELSVATGRPLRVRLRALSRLVLMSLVRALGSVGVALYIWWRVGGQGLFKVKFSDGALTKLNMIYCAVYVGGAFVLATVYISWFRAALKTLTSTRRALAQQVDGSMHSARSSGGKRRGSGAKKG